MNDSKNEGDALYERDENHPGQQGLNLEQLNSYSDQKSYAKGLVDLALITANASQLRNMLVMEDAELRSLNIALLSLSIILQVSANLTRK